MIRRTFSTVILWSIAVAALYLFREHAGVGIITALALTTQYELYRLLDKAGIPTRKLPGLIAGALLLPGAYYAPFLLPGLGPLEAALYALGIGTLLLISTALFPPRERVLETLAGTVLGVLITVFPLHFFVQILALGPEKEGLVLAIWVVMVVKFTDVGAYLIGTWVGRHKLAPSLSPGKTWEGVGGGLVFAVLLGAGLAAVLPGEMPDSMTPLLAGLIAVPLAAVSIPSDLVESVFKRAAGAKDSGDTIPGIGGAYDVTDSLILSTPVAYFLFLIFISG